MTTGTQQNYQKEMPPIVWLRMVGYMHGWLEYELSGTARSHGKQVVCARHLPGVRDAMRMETREDIVDPGDLPASISVTHMDCLKAGMCIDAETVARRYGATSELLSQYVPVECPPRCLTRHGVLRPWTHDVAFGDKQARTLQHILREAFWSAVEVFDKEYAAKQGGRKYAAEDMVEDFCDATNTPCEHVAAIRREWQRRQKRMNPQSKAI